MTVQQVKQKYAIIGNCPEINTAVEVAMQVAPTEVTALIYGENGTGKDVFSRIIHQYSRRKHNPFMAINTGAIPEGTLDSELFGHEKGSFTSAYEARKGYFEEVEGGSIFLDEIGEMPMATQARLLRLLENGEYLRVGSSKVRKADVRVIAATNKNLVEMIRQGKFREDLFFRLNTISIQVPPLRDRGADIELLFRYFALEFAEKYRREAIELEEEAVGMLHRYRWPGNVRELRNLVEKLTVIIKGNFVSVRVLQENLTIQEVLLPVPIERHSFEMPGTMNSAEAEKILSLIHHLGSEVKELKSRIGRIMDGKGSESNRFESPIIEDYPGQVILTPIQPVGGGKPLLEESLNLEKMEKQNIIKALEKHNNNRKKAATELGISERTLYRKINSYDIDL